MFVVRSGRSGTFATKEILSSGKKVRVFTRDVNKLNDLKELGAEITQVNGLSDIESLSKALSNTKAAYVLIAPGIIPSSNNLLEFQKKEIDNLVESLKKAENLENIVALSSWGADKENGTGQISSQYYMEQEITKHLKDKVRSIIYLRACSFMENLESMINAFKAGYTHGVVSSAMLPDLKVPQICTYDIGKSAAKVMLNIDKYPPGVTVLELQGAEDLTMNEITKILSEHYNIPNATYKQESMDDLAKNLTKYGFTDNTVQCMKELHQAINTGHIQKLQPRNSETSTPTTFKEFLISLDKENKK